MNDSDKSVPRVLDLMTDDPIVITPELSVVKVLALMREAAIRHLPVVDEDGIMGMLSRRDLNFIHGVPGVFEGVKDEDLEEILEAPVGVVLKSRSLVDRDVIALDRDDELKKAVDLFVSTSVGALPVIDEDGEVVGILSAIDVLRWVADDVLGE